MNNLKPQNGYLIIEVIKEDAEKVTNGIVIPDSVKENQEEMSMIGIADIKASDDENYSVGDIILYLKSLPTEFQFEDQNYLAVRGKDIIAKITK